MDQTAPCRIRLPILAMPSTTSKLTFNVAQFDLCCWRVACENGRFPGDVKRLIEEVMRATSAVTGLQFAGFPLILGPSLSPICWLRDLMQSTAPPLTRRCVTKAPDRSRILLKRIGSGTFRKAKEMTFIDPSLIGRLL